MENYLKMGNCQMNASHENTVKYYISLLSTNTATRERNAYVQTSFQKGYS